MNSTAQRPLSPHLQIYRRTILMMMSIMHRATGLALYVGVLVVAAWLLALAMGPSCYDLFMRLAHSPGGLFIFLGLSWCLFHHMLGGVRHLIWDTVTALDVPSARLLAWLNLIVSLGLTALLWGLGAYTHGN